MARDDTKRPVYTPLFGIAKGGMGEVELVARREDRFMRLFAMKRLRPELVEDDDSRAMFLEEGRVAGLIRHANVVSVLDVGDFDTSSDAAYLDRLYIPGLRRAGDLKTAAALARGTLVIHNAGDRFDVGVNGRPDPLAVADIVKTLKDFGRTRGSR